MVDARSTLTLAAALVAAGVMFDAPVLLLPGIALLLLAGGAWAWVELATREARVERPRGPASVEEGEPYPLRIVIRRGRVPPRGELTDPLLEQPRPVRARVRGRVSEVSLSLRFKRRGRFVLAPSKLIVRDPLRLHSREVESEHGGELLVLPRVEPVTAPGDAGGGEREGEAAELGDGAGARALEASAIEFEIDGLRPYREGSPASRIHWPVVARTGELIERRLVAGDDSSPLVVLDAEQPEDEESLDRAVRAAASLCVHLARTGGGCALLLPRERRPLPIDPELRGWPVAHARLAVVEAGRAPTGMARSGHTGPVLWVTTRRGGPPRAAGGQANPISYLVSPHPLPGVPASFTVAGCHGQALAAGRRAGRRGRRVAA